MAVMAAAITSGSPADSIFPRCCRICAILLKREGGLLEIGAIGLGKGEPRRQITRLKLTTTATIKERSLRIHADSSPWFP